MTNGQRHERHSGGSQKDAEPLQRTQPFSQTKTTQEHRDQGIDKIAKAGLQHLPLLDGIDVYRPVAGYQQRGQNQGYDQARLTDYLYDPPDASIDNGDNKQHGYRPDDAMSQHLQRLNTVNALEIERRHPPGCIGNERIHHTAVGIGSLNVASCRHRNILFDSSYGSDLANRKPM